MGGQQYEHQVKDRVSCKFVTKRPHHKSRKGCNNCKTRKVKCDENKPTCSNCVKFGMLCVSGKTQVLATNPITSAAGSLAESNKNVSLSRGRGRPRKSYTFGASTTPQKPRTAPGSPAVQKDCLKASSLDVTEIELLLHFSSSTALTFTGTSDSDARIRKFWQQNVAQIGMTHHFVLHLIFAVAAYHLIHLENLAGRHQQPQQQRYLSLAQHHTSVGISALTRTIQQQLNGENCGAVYVAAVLVCYCTFAAGPTDSDDVLVCSLGSTNPVIWLQLLHGVRSISATYHPSVLFSGLMSPLNPHDKSPIRPIAHTHTHRLDWEEPLADFRRFLVTTSDSDDGVCLKSFDEVLKIYEATYGRRNRPCNVARESQFVFGWLYRLDETFVAHLSSQQPLALLVYAYYCLLFESIDQGWYVRGWTGHVLSRLKKANIGEGLAGWLRWPMEQAGLRSF